MPTDKNTILVDNQTAELGGFRLLHPLGHGAFATAYLAQQVGTERKAVVKIAHQHMIVGHHGDMIRQRFDAEVRAITRIQHPNMVTVYTSGLTPQGIPYIAMEFVQGRTLDQLLQQHAPLPFHTAHALFEQVASVLKSAHSMGVVHRDITPNNIMIQEDEQGRLVARVLDFGLAMLDEKHSHTVGPIGTPRYLAPEQLNGNPTTRSDMFSLGAVMWWAITGREYLEQASSIFDIFRIYNAQSAPLDPRTVNPAVPHELAAVITGLLQPDPISRPDAVTFLHQWAALAPRPTSGVFPTPPEGFTRRPASSGEWMRPGSQPRAQAPRVTTHTGIGLGGESSTALATPTQLPRHEQIIAGMSVLHLCTDAVHSVKVETHLEQLGGFVTRVETFEALLTEIISQRPDIILLDSQAALPHAHTVALLASGMPTPAVVLYIDDLRPRSLPDDLSFISRASLITELAPHLRHALNSPLRRIIAQLDSHPGLDIASLSPRIAREPAALSTQIGSFIGDTPELLAQIEEAIDLQDLALAQGLNNALYNNASRLGLSNLSHALAQLATCLQPQRAHTASPQLAEAEREYMAAFPVILKLRTALQELI